MTYEDVTSVDSVGVVTARTGVDVTTGGVDIANGGLNVVGVSTFQGNVNLGDNDRLRFGDGNFELQMYHSGSNSIIRDNGPGNLVLGSNGDSVKITKGVNTENLAIFNTDGAVELYYDNSKKFETTSGGVTVTGNVTADGLRLGDSDYAYFGDGNDLQGYHDGSHSYIDDAGTGNLN